MTRRACVALVVATAAFAFAALPATAAAVHISVSPSSGRPTSRFVVRFRARSTTSTALHRRYELYASGARSKGCTSSVSMALGATHAGAQVRVTLKPKSTWCVGIFRGRIVEYVTIICQPIKGTAIACPEVMIAPQTIGRFTFRVTKSSSSSSSSGGSGTGPSAGPSFAGLQQVTYCVPVLKVLPAQRTYELSWSPATDPSTPSSQIVYEIFSSSTQGGENYSSPTWTAPPGVTQYTVTLPGSAPAYFVVRARDAAGHTDDNTVEPLPINTCTNS